MNNKKLKIWLSASIGVLASFSALLYVLKNNFLFAGIFAFVAIVQFAVLLPRYMNEKDTP